MKTFAQVVSETIQEQGHVHLLFEQGMYFLNQTTQLPDSSEFVLFDTPDSAMAFEAFPTGACRANGSHRRINN
jgi:hypothetical protein